MVQRLVKKVADRGRKFHLAKRAVEQVFQGSADLHAFGAQVFKPGEFAKPYLPQSF
jgi:hypothetical protein